MPTINARSLTPSVQTWLAETRQPRVLHVFDNACNLINEHKEVLSVVTPQIGNGPFNLVVRNGFLFSQYIGLHSPVSNSPNSLSISDITITIPSVKFWNPQPDWIALHSQKNDIIQLLIMLSRSEAEWANYQPPILQFSNSLRPESPVSSLGSQFSNSIVSNDLSSAKEFAAKLAGLGIGLTPSGDDFIVGALHAAWIIHPTKVAQQLGEEIANTAIPLTTSLSAAWIRFASRGEVGELWHQLFNSLILQSSDLESSISNILAVGETSGADALAGFLSVMTAW